MSDDSVPPAETIFDHARFSGRTEHPRWNHHTTCPQGIAVTPSVMFLAMNIRGPEPRGAKAQTSPYPHTDAHFPTIIIAVALGTLRTRNEHTNKDHVLATYRTCSEHLCKRNKVHYVSPVARQHRKPRPIRNLTLQHKDHERTHVRVGAVDHGVTTWTADEGSRGQTPSYPASATTHVFGTRLRTSVHGHTARLCAHYVFHAALCVRPRVLVLVFTRLCAAALRFVRSCVF